MTDAQEKWKKISSDTLEIMLPKSFIGGNPRKDKRRITEEISRNPEDLQKAYKSLFKGRLFMFVAGELKKEGQVIHVLNMGVKVVPLPLLEWGASLEKLVEKELPKGKVYTVAEKGLIALANYQAARAVIQLRESRGAFKAPGEVKQVMWLYTLKEAHRSWIFYCVSDAAQADRAREIYEQAMQSLQLKVK